MLLYFSQRIIEQQEHKNSSLKEELVAVKEALNRALLDKEVLDQQRSEISKLILYCINDLPYLLGSKTVFSLQNSLILLCNSQDRTSDFVQV